MFGPFRGAGRRSASTPRQLLALRAVSDLTAVAPGSTTELFAVLELVAAGDPLDASRAQLSVVFVLDTSGSMLGEPLAQVCDSVSKLADLLAPTDRAGVIAFSDHPSEVAPLAPLSDSARAGLRRRLHALKADGHTGLTAGVGAGRALLGPRAEGERQVLVVLTDGQPTDGTTAITFAELARSFRPDVAVAALGYGVRHNAELLRAFAEGGGGQYWYIPDPAQANVEFARAVGSQGDVVVDGVQLVLVPGVDVEVLEVLGEPKLRFGADGARIALPDLRDGERRTAVVRLQVRAPREAGRLCALEVKVEHRRAGSSRPLVVRGEVALEVSHRQHALVEPAARAQVLLARAELVRRQARAQCDLNRYDAAAVLLRAMIAELEAAPGYAKLDGSPLSEAVEQLIDEAVMCERKPNATEYNEFRAATLGVNVAQGGVHVADRKPTSKLGMSTMSSMLDDSLTGEVIIEMPGHPVQRVALKPDMTVGRTPGNDILVPLGSVGKRHMRILCRLGKVLVADLGSSNGVQVNGVEVKLKALEPGDVIQLGDAKLRVVLR